MKGEEKAFENIRKAGFDTYLPRQRLEIKNHKTHTYALREIPLMPRYLFVAFPPRNQEFYAVNKCDCVVSILSIDGCPVRISPMSVETIFLAEADLAFDDTRAARIRRKEEVVSAKENTVRQFPAGQSVFVIDPANPFLQHGGIVQGITATGKVKALLEIFGRLTPVEFEAQQLSPVA